MNTSPSLSPPGSDLDGLVAELRAHVRYRYMPDACRQAMDRAAAAIRSLRKGSESAGLYTEAHERLDDMARESIARAEAAESRAAKLDEALREARDLLLERIHGNPARSAGHNARLVIQAALQPQVGGDA